MDVFSSPASDGHERVVFAQDRESGLRAIIAIHDTRCGPAVGGCRYWPYASTDEALTDVLRLSRGMTLKSVMAGLGLGGGKSVILADPAVAKGPALLHAFGRAVEGLGGLYYAAEDVGTSPADMDLIGEATRYVLGRSCGGGGDPSPVTARGVWLGIRMAVRRHLGRSNLEGVRVAIQGLGHVGFELARLLRDDGARLLVADLDSLRVERAVVELGAEVTGCEAILAAEVDVLAPCALGGVINDRTLSDLRCAIVAGAANNQLLEPRHGRALHHRGILYAPDYVINAGGIINIAEELEPGGYDRDRALERVRGIASTLDELFARAGREGGSTADVADRMALERLAAARAEAGDGPAKAGTASLAS